MPRRQGRRESANVRINCREGQESRMSQTMRRDAPYTPGAAALLLVDMQRIWLEPGRNPAHPDWSADHYFHRETATRAVPNQRRLLDAARASGVEVIHTIIRSLTSDGRDRSLDHKLTP